MQDGFVGAEHDRRAWNDPQHVRNQASVQPLHSFLKPDELETLDETGVFELAVLHRCLT